MFKKLNYLRKNIKTADMNDLQAELAFFDIRSDEELFILVNLIKEGKRNEAAEWLDDYLTKTNALRLADDISVDGLKTKVKMLEVQLSVMLNKLAETQHVIGEYRVTHYKEMNEAMLRLLLLRKEVLSLKSEKDSSFKKEYDAALDDEKQYKSTPAPAHVREKVKLSVDEDALMQKRYRQASKLCHPDLVCEKMKTEAENCFVLLSKAYMVNDLKKVTEIYTKLENGELIFSKPSGVLSESDLLRATASRLQEDIYKRSEEINAIENSSLMHTIRSIDQWDLYFSALRKRFEGEIFLLENELKELLS